MVTAYTVAISSESLSDATKELTEKKNAIFLYDPLMHITDHKMRETRSIPTFYLRGHIERKRQF